jgi:replication factor A1
MIRIPKETLIEKIKEKSGISDKDLKSKVRDKLDQLSGLISEEGALHIIANELGVKIFEEAAKLQIKNVLPGMRNIELTGRIVKKYEVREFDTNSRKGKVGSFLIGDQTGVIRAVAWNDKADLLDKIKENDVIKIESGYAKDNNGRLEVHLGDRTKVHISPEGSENIEVKPLERNHKKISELKENEENAEVMGTIVQVFDPRFFPVDSQTGKKLTEKERQFYLNDTLVEKPDYAYVTNIFLDDGTENIRVVLWKNQTQRLFNMSHDDILQKKDSSFEDIKTELLGKIVKFVGRTQKNQMFDRIEYIPQLVFLDPNPDEEIARLDEELKKAVSEDKQQEPGDTEVPVANTDTEESEDSDSRAEEDDMETGSQEDEENPEKKLTEKPERESGSEDFLEDIDDLSDLDI